MTWLTPQPSPKASSGSLPPHRAPGWRERGRDEAKLETKSSHPPPCLHLWFSDILAKPGSTWGFLSPPRPFHNHLGLVCKIPDSWLWTKKEHKTRD